MEVLKDATAIYGSQGQRRNYRDALQKEEEKAGPRFRTTALRREWFRAPILIPE